MIPIIIAISGGSGSGKSTLCDRIVKDFEEDCVSIIREDDYYKTVPTGISHKDYNFDSPESRDHEKLKNDIDKLKYNPEYELKIREYDFKKRESSGKYIIIKRKKYIIIEGTHVLSPDMVGKYDVSVYIDTPDDIRILRRIKRDVEERGRDIQEIIEQYDKYVRPMHIKYTAAWGNSADIVLKDDSGALEDCRSCCFLSKSCRTIKEKIINTEKNNDKLSIKLNVIKFSIIIIFLLLSFIDPFKKSSIYLGLCIGSFLFGMIFTKILYEWLMRLMGIRREKEYGPIFSQEWFFSEILTGIIERLFFTICIGVGGIGSISNIMISSIAWTALKCQVHFKIFTESNNIKKVYLSVFGSIISMAFAVIGGFWWVNGYSVSMLLDKISIFLDKIGHVSNIML